MSDEDDLCRRLRDAAQLMNKGHAVFVPDLLIDAAWEIENRRAPSAAPPVVKDCLTTQAAYRAGAAEMRERAAEQVDCGCSWRADALAATNKGERFVACGNDPCGAIEARAIRALPLPAGGSGWRDIETAPRDGTRFWGKVGDDAISMLWHEHFKAFVSSWRRMTLAPGMTFADTGKNYEDHSPETHEPKWWQPLPAAPEEGG